ncbi:MAG: rhodanese-like domain-containing protein [Microcystaceae cyanobacterium]
MKRTFFLLLTVLIATATLSFYSPLMGRLMATDFPTEEAKTAINSGAILIDVRTPEEFAAGHIDGAVNIPYDQISERISEITEDKTRVIVLYCRSGGRATIAEKNLRSTGFTNILNAGGYSDLRESNP